MLDFKEQLMAIRTEMDKEELKIDKINDKIVHREINPSSNIRTVYKDENKINQAKNNFEQNNINIKPSNKILVKRGQVFWADLGNNNQGSEQQGIRPIIIIQNDVGNTYSPTTIVAVITSQLNKAKLPVHVELPKGIINGIPKDSVILFEQIRTLDKRRLKDKICQLDELMMYKIDKALGTSVGIKIAEIEPIKQIKEKNTLEKLPKEVQSYIINKLKFIDVCKSSIEFYKMLKADRNSIDMAEDEKFKEENSLMYYCDKNNINYNEIYNCYIEMKEGADNNEIAL